MKKSNLYLSVFLFTTVFGLAACNGPESKNSPSQVETAQGSLDAIQLDSLDPQLDDMETKLYDATKEINALSILNLTNIGNSTGAEAKAQGLADKISDILNKLVAVVEQVAAKKAELRAKIDAIAAKLDPNAPNYAQLKKRVDEMLAYLDQLDAKIKELHSQLIAKIDAKVIAIDNAIAKMNPNSPLTWIVSLVWQTVKVKVVEARDKLAAIKL